jgi:hypothetical protein
MTKDELLDGIEQWAERASNALAATEIPMPPQLHVLGLSESLRGTLREMCITLGRNGRDTSGVSDYGKGGAG